MMRVRIGLAGSMEGGSMRKREDGLWKMGNLHDIGAAALDLRKLLANSL